MKSDTPEQIFAAKLITAYERLLPDMAPELANQARIAIRVFVKDSELFRTPPSNTSSDPIAIARHKDALRRYQHLQSNLKEATDIVEDAFADIFQAIAEITPTGASSFSIPLHSLISDPTDFTQTIVDAFMSERAKQYDLFTLPRYHIHRAFEDLKERRIKDPETIMWGILEHLAITKLLFLDAPFSLSKHVKYHWMILGRTGSGKSQLLQTLILETLKTAPGTPLIVIDSQGYMLDLIERLGLPTLSQRLVVVDPAASPALNMFDIPRLSEDAEIEVLELYNYIFSAIDADLTSRQGTAFSYVIRLMLATPGATIMTLLELMEEQVKTPEQSKFWPIIQTLDPVALSYFQTRFYSTASKQTKEQLATRLYGVLRVRAFQRMFAAQDNKLDLYQCIQQGKVVLVRTDGLGEAANLFGRYIIAQCLQAAFRRDISREPQPALLFIDEAHKLLDENVNRILIQARKFGLFVRFATQHYDQIPNDVRAAAASNTEVKLAGGLSVDDARRLAGEFRTDADTMLSTRKVDRSHAEFMCYVQNAMERPVKLSVPFGIMEREPRDPHHDPQRYRAPLLATTTEPPPLPQPDQKKFPSSW